jgi:citrate lyase subunit beta/citryl-CoA lyase
VTVRSYLYVPGNRPDRFPKAASSGADAVILDLEDAVPADEKDAARKSVIEWLMREHPGAPEVWVRVNATPILEDDITTLVSAATPRGVIIPKVSTADDIARVDILLGDSPIEVVPLIETASGVLEARAIASAPRVAHLALGEADLSAELRVDASPDGRELAVVRTHVVLASAAAGIDPPVAPVSTDFADLNTLRESTRALKRMGFGGRAAIHPAQVPVINEVFTPTQEEVSAARALVDAFESGGGRAFRGPDGRMVDEAIVRAARRTLELARG